MVCYCKQKAEAAICGQYSEFQTEKLLLGQGITVFIVALNKVLQVVSIRLITWIGYDTHSELLTKITNGVFVAQFLNTGVMILLVNANLGDGPFAGRHNDYTDQWYADVGYTLVQTMLLNAFVPLFSQLAFSTIAWVKRRRDSGGKAMATKTKQVI